jgi:hypothetical protein
LKRGDEGVVMLQQLADHGRDGVGGGGRPNSLQIAAGAEGAAFAFDHQHPDLVRRLDLRAELLELFRDRKIDRVEGGGPVEGDGGDRALNPEQCRIVRQGGGNVC